MHQIVQIRANPAQNAKDHLDENRPFNPSLIHHPRKVIKMAQIIAFKFKPRAVALAQFLDRVFDVGKCVSENKVPRHAQKFGFPVMFPFAVFVQHWENSEIDGSHIHAGHFGAGAHGGTQAFFARHAQAAACRNVHHCICGLFDAGQEFHKQIGVWIGFAVFGIAGMQVDDGCARLGRFNTGRGDFAGRNGQMF